MNKIRVNWLNIIFFASYHALLIIMLPLYLLEHVPSNALLWATLLTFIISGLGVTACYHRFYSHQSFKANKLVEIILLIAGTLATVNSALKWAHDHRLHHRYVDQDKDPYNYQKGFFWAHIGWLMTRRAVWQPSVVKGLQKNKLLMFQHHFYFLLAPGLNFVCVYLVGMYCQDYLGAFIFVFLLRMFFMHHCTFAINSFAHCLGSQPFSKRTSAVNNWLLSLFTFGEGYHNYHHTFAYDYRNGPFWYNFDPTKWLIWGLKCLGAAYDLKRIDMPQIYKAMVDEKKDVLLTSWQQQSGITQDIKNKMTMAIQQKTTELQLKIEELRLYLAEYHQLSRHTANSKTKKEELKKLIYQLKKQFHTMYRQLSNFHCSS